MLQQFGHNFKDYEISIMESHQSSKLTEPGTAYHLGTGHALCGRYHNNLLFLGFLGS